MLPDTQVDTEEDDITTNTIIHNETADNEVDDIKFFIERKFNDLSQIMEKRLHKLENQIIGLQNLNLLGNVANNIPITADIDFYTDLLKKRIIELENQLSEKNPIINYLMMQLIPKSQDKKYVVALAITIIKLRLIKTKITTPNWKNKIY